MEVVEIGVDEGWMVLGSNDKGDDVIGTNECWTEEGDAVMGAIEGIIVVGSKDGDRDRDEGDVVMGANEGRSVVG